MIKTLKTIDGFVVKSGRRRVTLSEMKNVRSHFDHSSKIENNSSIDGFYVKPADQVVSSDSWDGDNINKTVNSILDNGTNSINISGDPENKLISDIEASLGQIDDIDLVNEENISDRRQDRHAVSEAPKKRKHFNVAKIWRILSLKNLRRLIIIILIFALAGGAYFGYKALVASSKVFKGNPLSIITKKTRLAEDKNGRTNVLIFGTSGYSMNENAWDGALLTDSIMVVSIDQDKGDAYLISLPRDLYVKHSCRALGTTAGKLNETFYCHYKDANSHDVAAKAFMAKAGEILNLDIQYYVHVNWSALLGLVNSVGGVDIKIDSRDPRGIYDSGTHIRYKNGEIAHLDGAKALALARARNHNAIDYGLSAGNYDREKNQQKILAALQKKILSTGTLLNPAAVNGLIDSLGNNLQTNFQTENVQALIDVAKKIKSDKMIKLPFVNRDDGGINLIVGYTQEGQYKGEAPVKGVFDYSDIQSYIAKNLSSDPMVKEDAVIDVLNGSGQNGLAASKASDLKAIGFNLGNVANSPKEIDSEVVIYQLNDNKSATLKALQKQYKKSKLETNPLDNYNTKADFVVVFGPQPID